MHKLVFGKLKWKPYDYYTATPYEVECAIDGYNEERVELAAMLRMSSYRIHQSLVTKPLKIHEYWQLPSDSISSKENTKIIADESILEAINKAHKTNFKIKKKDATA